MQTPFSPSAATVSISGRITTQNSAGVSNAVVSMTDQQGNVRRIKTSAFGYYGFDEVVVGQTYTVEVSSKRYEFNAQIVSVEDNVQDLDFVASGSSGKSDR